ncbi:MAG: phosphoribosylglycinamide formyltransferase [Saprospiraceae bacterium]|nr:phosphoribosylglycinamide formyltransferase [Saprospiraceae bacterium]
MQHRIAIFASGSGSNALKIMEYFANHPTIKVALVVCNKKDAGVLLHANRYNIESVIISKSIFYETENVLETLTTHNISCVVLAGFLLLIPEYIIKNYEKRIVNIHPALLPKFGGKGMFGHHVHEAVRAANESESGITIHFCNAQYDEGDVIFQAKCPVLSTDTPTDIAKKVLALEHKHFAPVIESILIASA